MSRTIRSAITVCVGILFTCGAGSTDATIITLAPDGVVGFAASAPTQSFPNYFSQFSSQGSAIETTTSTFNAALVGALGPAVFGYDIISATLTIGNFVNLPGPGSAHLLTTTFDPAAATWNMRDVTHTWTAGSFSAADYGSPVSTGTISVVNNTESFTGLAAVVQSWLNGATNDGLAFPADGGAFTGPSNATAIWTLDAIRNVPEPAGLAMLALGGMGLLAAARRRSGKTLRCPLMSCRMKSLVAGIALSLVVIASEQAVQAGPLVVNVDINSATSATYTGTGAVYDPGTHWDAINGSGTFPTPTLLESDGLNNSGITFSLTGSFNSFDPSLVGGATAFAPDLLSDGVYTGATTALTGPQFSLNNVPAGTYNLILYSLNGNGGATVSGPNYGNGAKTTFVVGGVNQQVVNPLHNAADPSFHGFVNGGNYTEYVNISPVAGVISGVFFDSAGMAGTFDGFQLVLVPEPSSFVLIGLGLAALFAIRRRGR